MLHSPITPARKSYVDFLRLQDDEEVLERFYTCLRWVNYFQDEDTQYVYRKIYQDVLNEVKRRKLKYTWTSEDVKKYRILAQKMYYGSLSFKELEWRLGCIMLYSVPVCRTVVKEKMYLVRETIQVIIECMHEQHRWSELEYHKDILYALDAPLFCRENLSIMSRFVKGLVLLGENVLIFFLFLCQTGLTVLRPIWDMLDPDYSCLRNILQIIEIFVTLVWVACYVYELFD